LEHGGASGGQWCPKSHSGACGTLGCVAGDERAILLFDGVCNVCEWTVCFVVPRDPQGRFRFASLQSNAAGRLLRQAGLPLDQVDTVVLIEGERVSLRSTAILRVLRRLVFPWPLLYPLILVPRALRDRAYDAFAARRYRWFGKQDTCLVPGPDLATRFLEVDYGDVP
jgi:predicted DCC family thiol-disulfide oxidoreductase YuxK